MFMLLSSPRAGHGGEPTYYSMQWRFNERTRAVLDCGVGNGVNWDDWYKYSVRVFVFVDEPCCSYERCISSTQFDHLSEALRLVRDTIS